MNSLKDYFDVEMKLMAGLPLERVDAIVAKLHRARFDGRRIFVFGNGGSASTASHFACDLGKGTIKPDLPRFQVFALNDAFATITAYANDNGYDSVFAEPLITHAQRGDIALGISVSGNSPNVVRALETAEKLGLTTVAFTGFAGGKIKDRAEYHVNVPSESFGHVEDIHLALTHAICEMLKLQHDPH
ncbi:MAG: SIS domain-containing protein [Chloroflexi bacterium]|nr:SIS domain-containing protein [Chloroflexota bacterium]